MTVKALPANETLSARGRYLVLAGAFLGWLFAGVQMGIMPLATGPATTEFARRGFFDEPHAAAGSPETRDAIRGAAPGATRDANRAKNVLKTQIPLWYAWYSSTFLFGGAAGGLIFGWIGDRAGRVKALAWSILCYSAFSGLAYFASSPNELLALRFLAALGVGGMWPAGVALASEAWSEVSRPTLAGLIGTAANVGIIGMSYIGYRWDITVDNWRWVMLVGASSLSLGLFVQCCVPESPRWLRERGELQAAGAKVGLWEVFRPPLLRLTLLGICLGAIPLLGGWGTTSWVIPWSDAVNGATDPKAKAMAAMMRSAGGSLGSLLGGWLANLLGRRAMYFLISLSSLTLSGYLFRYLSPADHYFSHWVFALGFVTTIFFGWLPLYLPELFPTQARATGAGVSFNFGRIATAIGVLGTGALVHHFHGAYDKVGQVTSLVYALGMLVILFAPDTKRLKD